MTKKKQRECEVGLITCSDTTPTFTFRSRRRVFLLLHSSSTLTELFLSSSRAGVLQLIARVRRGGSPRLIRRSARPSPWSMPAFLITASTARV